MNRYRPIIYTSPHNWATVLELLAGLVAALIFWAKLIQPEAADQESANRASTPPSVIEPRIEDGNPY
jgi:hypothetical protein